MSLCSWVLSKLLNIIVVLYGTNFWLCSNCTNGAYVCTALSFSEFIKFYSTYHHPSITFDFFSYLFCSESKLTQLLQEEIGGNCKTRAIICLKPKTDSDITAAVLKFATNLSHIRNFPIVNDALAQVSGSFQRVYYRFCFRWHQ